MLRRWFTVRVLEPLKAQLTQGVSPVRLAVALALGLTLGTFPVLGTTTALCALAALGLRLNQPAIQVANYLAYPLQLAAYLPLFAAGAALFGAPPVTFTLAGIQAELAADLPATVARYAGANLRAVVAWALAAPAAFGLAFLALRPILARLPLPAPSPER
ncbi:MAG: DUF2062 domain-containing protein [Anaeromyxobacter sp.]|nr:DUF2062 domain-containing protein [Anaeromyxobacter sp.]MBL0278664.1 DUF2062 domain-containing protein [Anaeromyxobacter sp.]